MAMFLGTVPIVVLVLEVVAALPADAAALDDNDAAATAPTATPTIVFIASLCTLG